MPSSSGTADSKRGYYEKLLGSGAVMKTFKVVAARVLEIVGNPYASARDLSNLISMDPALSARVLTVINSPHYGLAYPIEDLLHAITLLGFDEMKNIALSVSFFEAFDVGERIHMARLWRHSIYCAKLCQMLGETVGRLSGEAFTVGLLHDMGKILLCHYNHRAFALALHNYMYERGRIAHWESEDRILSINHAYLGYFAGQNWKIPQIVCEAILNHHSPPLGGGPRDKTRSLTQIVYVSNLLCNLMGYSSVPVFHTPDASQPLRYFDQRLYPLLDISEEEIEEALQSFHKRRHEAEAFFAFLDTA